MPLAASNILPHPKPRVLDVYLAITHDNKVSCRLKKFFAMHKLQRNFSLNLGYLLDNLYVCKLCWFLKPGSKIL